MTVSKCFSWNIQQLFFRQSCSLQSLYVTQSYLHRKFISKFRNRCPYFNPVLTSQFHTTRSAGFSSHLHQTVSGSKYHPPNPDEVLEMAMCDVLKSREEMEPEEWEELKNDFYIKSFILNDSNFDSITMNVLVKVNNLSLANSFMKYLKKTSVKPNVVTNMKYMLLCSKHMDVCQQDTILKTYEKVRPLVENLPALDSNTLNCVVQGLCATDKWRTALNYMKRNLFTKPHNETKSVMAAAAFRNDDDELGWTIITTWINPLATCDSNMLSECVKHAARMYAKDPATGDNLMEKLLKYLHSKNAVIKARNAQEIAKYFESHKLGWIIKKSEINDDGSCDTCKKQLKVSKLSHAEFHTLRKEFLEKSLHKYDVFINTTEDEFRQFMQYVDRHKPFDAVVDGLNIAYATEEFETRKNKAIRLREVVNKLSLSADRILIIGRDHMKSWPRKIMGSILNKAKIFFTRNTTQEDPFLIYAALASGPDCLVVSSDLMRDHASRLHDPQYIHLYNQWQQSHQIYVSSSSHEPVFKGPLKHSVRVQGSMNTGWHIPYDNEFVLEAYEVLNNWLCIQRIL